ncbi:Venom carboxylesterase-6 [Gryllus bimaculatus]|nr:Venom carboxylesterase-6 [Gryllus bimaculatus]
MDYRVAVAAGAEGGARVKRIVGGEEAPSPPPDDPTAFDEAAGAWRPRRVALEGEVDATRAPPPCPQPGPGGRVVGSEDCLFLNVFTPQLPGGRVESFPVLVWIHGGGFRRGSANQYGANPLVRRRVVVVVPQYRLGSLGFLSAGTAELPGNAGLFDMAAALAWVQQHVAAFGGDPRRVTVFGQGSGAAAAVLLSLSSISRGLLGGVLALSGSALSSFALDLDPLGTSRDLAARSNCPHRPALALVRCLQEAPVEALVGADSALEDLRLRAQGLLAGLTGLLGAAPVVDGPDDDRGLPHFLPRPPLDLLKAPLGPDDLPLPPLVTGVTAAETATAIYGDFRQEVIRGIATVPGYVDHLLGGLIKCTAPLVGNMTGTLLHTLATNYFSFLSIKDTPQALNRLVEVTGDALFNLPAWTTAQWWSKRSPLYLYVFEHASSQQGGGAAFLQGLPLVSHGNGSGSGGASPASGNDADMPDPPHDAGPGHGDDLPFAFDAHPLEPAEGAETNEPDDIFGLSDPQDFSVQGHVTDFIAEFARSGVPAVRGANVSWPAFAPGGGGRHLRVGPSPRAADDFRTCQMELWTGALARSGLPAALLRRLRRAPALGGPSPAPPRRWRRPGLSERRRAGRMGRLTGRRRARGLRPRPRRRPRPRTSANRPTLLPPRTAPHRITLDIIVHMTLQKPH